MSTAIRLPAEQSSHACHNCCQQLATEPPSGACRYGVKYPALYASGSDDNANAFNCVQRGHQNSLEQLPHFYAVFTPSAIKVHPCAHCHMVTPDCGKRSYLDLPSCLRLRSYRICTCCTCEVYLLLPMQYPIAAAVCALIYNAGKIVYFQVRFLVHTVAASSAWPVDLSASIF
jgi:MAPEG family